MTICKHCFSVDHTKAIKRHTRPRLCPLIAPPPEGEGGGNRVLLNNHGCAALLCGVSRTDIARECVNVHVCIGSAVENCGCGIALNEKPCCSVKGSAIHRHCSTVGNCLERSGSKGSTVDYGCSKIVVGKGPISGGGHVHIIYGQIAVSAILNSTGIGIKLQSVDFHHCVRSRSTGIKIIPAIGDSKAISVL